MHTAIIVPNSIDFNQYIHAPIPLESKTDVLVQILNQVRFLIIFDNFEDCLKGVPDLSGDSLNKLRTPKETRVSDLSGEIQIADPDLAKFIRHLLNNVASNTKFIFTTRYDFDPLKGRLEGEIEHISLAEFSFPMMIFLMNNFKELARLEFKKRHEIYKAIGGHPYALSMFSRHARVTSVDDLLMEITPVSKEMIEFTLLDKSYQKLSSRAQTLLKRLSVFEEAPGYEAVQWMMGDENTPSPKVADELKSLISWGLLAKQDEAEQEVYAMHTLVRDFAKERLEEDKSEDRQRLLTRAAQFYEMQGKVSASLWDYLSARDYYYQAGEYEKANVIVDAAYDHLLRWGYLELLMRLLNESIKTLEGRSKAVAKGNLARIYQDTGDYKTAIKLYQEVKEIFEKEGGKKNVAVALHQLGMIHQQQGNYQEAVRLYEESLKIKEELQNKSGIASSLGQLGRVHEEQGDYPGAMEKCLMALSIFEQLKSPDAEIARNNLANLRDKLGEAEFNRLVEELSSKR